MAKFLVWSDLHADAVTFGVSRLKEAQRVADQVVKAAVANEVDAVLFGGDLADVNNDGRTFQAQALMLQLALDLAREEDIPTWLLAGNHDTCSAGTGTSVLTPIHRVHPLVHVVGQPTWVLIRAVAVVFFPFAEVSHAYDPAKAAMRMFAEIESMFSRSAPKTKIVTLSHLTVPGIEPGEETTDMPRGRDVIFPLAETRSATMRLQGHYHHRQVFDPKDGGPPIHVIGSSMRLTATEEKNEPGFLIVEV